MAASKPSCSHMQSAQTITIIKSRDLAAAIYKTRCQQAATAASVTPFCSAANLHTASPAQPAGSCCTQTTPVGPIPHVKSVFKSMFNDGQMLLNVQTSRTSQAVNAHMHDVPQLKPGVRTQQQSNALCKITQQLCMLTRTSTTFHAWLQPYEGGTGDLLPLAHSTQNNATRQGSQPWLRVGPRTG